MKITITKTTYSDKSVFICLLIGSTSIKITQKQMDELVKGLNLNQSAKFGIKGESKAFESYTN